jgi:glyoxylase-like metal-dependent hydrolase (beta-lactamase superfamily II)
MHRPSTDSQGIGNRYVSTTTFTVTIAAPRSCRAANLAPATDTPWGAIRSVDRLVGVDTTFRVADGITGIDTKMVGRYLVTSAYLVEAEELALVETGPGTSSAAVRDGLAELGVGSEDLAHVVLTHIHLDHAGGAGAIARAFPKATVWVNERGAPHLAEPSRLVASTERVYGRDRMRAMFGPVEPIESARLRAIGEGDRIPLGGRSLDVLYTPGHASHHVSLHDEKTGAVFVGDALGVHLPDVGVLRPATPPPDLDVELAVGSIEQIRRRADLLLLSHFGPVAEVEHLCDLAERRIRSWADVVREGLRTDDDVERIASLLERQGAAEYREDSGEEIDMERYDVLSSIRMNAMGLIRYWKKRAERDAAELAQVPLAGGERAASGPGDQPS